MDLSTPPVVNTQHLDIVIPLASIADAYDFAGAVFLAEVRDYRGALSRRYQWKTGGSTEFPNSVLSFDDETKILKLSASSAEVLATFPPEALQGKTDPAIFAFEVGFYLPAAPGDLIGIGDGDFPVRNGVIR